MLVIFGTAGVLMARAWRWWPTIPHTLDMVFGMLTLGNLGMLLGWWADNGFAPLHDHGCRECVEAMERFDLTLATEAHDRAVDRLVAGNTIGT